MQRAWPASGMMRLLIMTVPVGRQQQQPCERVGGVADGPRGARRAGRARRRASNQPQKRAAGAAGIAEASDDDDADADGDVGGDENDPAAGNAPRPPRRRGRSAAGTSGGARPPRVTGCTSALACKPDGELL